MKKPKAASVTTNRKNLSKGHSTTKNGPEVKSAPEEGTSMELDKLDENSLAIKILRGSALAERYMELKSTIFNQLPHPVQCSSSQLLLLRTRITYIKEVTSVGVCDPFPESLLFSARNIEDFYKLLRMVGIIKSNWTQASDEGSPVDEEGDESSNEGFIPPPVPFSEEFEFYFEDESLQLVPLSEEERVNV